MRLFELKDIKFDPLLLNYWKQADSIELKFCFIQNNCRLASTAFIKFLENNGIGNAEIVPTGRIINDKKKFGWVQTDLPDTHYDALTENDIAAMHRLKLNPRDVQDRYTYIYSTPELLAQFCFIPHSWVELRGKIFDPSGFYIDGKSGQFDKLVVDKSNLASRYHYFS